MAIPAATPDAGCATGLITGAHVLDVSSLNLTAAVSDGRRGLSSGGVAKIGRPVRWTPDLVALACSLILQHGPKRAAFELGVTYTGMRESLRRRGVPLKSLRRRAAR